MWWLLIPARVLTTYVFFPVFLKKMADRISGSSEPKAKSESKRAVLIGWQFLICAGFSVAFAVFLNIANIELFGKFDWQFSYLWLGVAGLGILNSYACYSQWMAYGLSLSKTSVNTQLEDITSITIAFFALGESRFFNFQLTAGIILCLATAIILAGFIGKENLVNRRLMKNVLAYSVIWGVVSVSLRYFNLEGLGILNFLICWYGGSWIGTLLIYAIIKFSRKEAALASWKMNDQDKKQVPIVAFSAWISMALFYLIAKYIIVAVYQPVFLVSEAVIPTLIGLLYFHEREGMRPKEWLAIAIGLAGVILVSLS